MKVCVERRQQCSPKHVTFGHQHTHERIDVINEILSTPTLLPLRILPNSEILRIIVRGSQKCDGEILRTSEFAHYRERGSPGYRSQKAEVRIAGLQNIFTPPPSFHNSQFMQLILFCLPIFFFTILGVGGSETFDQVAAGWYTGWQSTTGFPLSNVSWSKYTHLTYAFA